MLLGHGCLMFCPCCLMFCPSRLAYEPRRGAFFRKATDMRTCLQDAEPRPSPPPQEALHVPVPAGAAAAADVPLFVVPSVAALRRLTPAEAFAAASRRQAVPGPAVATEQVMAAAAVLAAVDWPAMGPASGRASAAAAPPTVSAPPPPPPAAACRPGTRLEPDLLPATVPQRALLRSPSSGASAAALAEAAVRGGGATAGPAGSATRSGSGQTASPAPAPTPGASIAAGTVLPSGTDRSPETRLPPAKRCRVSTDWNTSSSSALVSVVGPDDRGCSSSAVVAGGPSAQARHARSRRSLAAAEELARTAPMTGRLPAHGRGIGGCRSRRAACYRNSWSTPHGQDVLHQQPWLPCPSFVNQQRCELMSISVGAITQQTRVCHSRGVLHAVVGGPPPVTSPARSLNRWLPPAPPMQPVQPPLQQHQLQLLPHPQQQRPPVPWLPPAPLQTFDEVLAPQPAVRPPRAMRPHHSPSPSIPMQTLSRLFPPPQPQQHPDLQLQWQPHPQQLQRPLPRSQSLHFQPCSGLQRGFSGAEHQDPAAPGLLPPCRALLSKQLQPLLLSQPQPHLHPQQQRDLHLQPWPQMRQPSTFQFSGWVPQPSLWRPQPDVPPQQQGPRLQQPVPQRVPTETLQPPTSQQQQQQQQMLAPLPGASVSERSESERIHALHATAAELDILAMQIG